MQLRTLILIIMGPLIIAIALGTVLFKQKKELALIEQQKAREQREREEELAKQREAKRKQQQEEEKEKVPKDLARRAEKAESYGKWRDAAQFYKTSLEFADTEETKRRLKAVMLAMEAEKLEDKEQWEEALNAYERARPDITHKDVIDKRIEHLQAANAYEAAMAKGEGCAKAGDKPGAIKAYQVALDLAVAHHLTTDVDRRLKQLQQKVEEKTAVRSDVMDLIEKLMLQRELFPLLAICNYLEKRPEYADIREKVARHKETVVQMIKAAPESASGMRAKTDQRFVTLSMKDGSEVTGELIEEAKNTCQVNVLSDTGSVSKRLIVRSSIKAVKRYTLDEMNDRAAQTLFAAVVRAYQGKDYLMALKLIGQIEYEFPESSILSNADDQKVAIARQAIGLVEKTGGTLDGMVAGAIEYCGGMCFACGGTGWVRCKTCNGTGRRKSQCHLCLGKGTRACDACGGTGKRGKFKCAQCEGKGQVKCEICDGKGEVERPCTVCAKHECPLCRGKMRKPLGPCRACGGTGRAAAGASCTQCGGSGIMVSNDPCPACGGSGVVGVTRCRECAGTGRREGRK